MIDLRSYQQDWIAGLRGAFAHGYRAPLGVLPTGGGKCLGKGTPVMLYDGRVVPVEDVRVGDLLMGPDSKPRRVESLARGCEAMYRVTPTKGDAYTVNESHILSLRMTPGNSIGFPDGALVNISVRDYLRKGKTFKHCAKGWRAAVDFAPSNEPLRIPAYMFGVWLGDGSSRHFSVTTGDPEIAQEMAGYAAALGMWLRVYQNSEGSAVIHIIGGKRGYTGRAGGPLGNALRSYGVLQNKHIPRRYLTGSRAERLDLLAGLIDTDGALSRTGYDLVFKARELADGTAFVARSLGLAAYVKPCRKVCTNNGVAGTYYRVSISGDCSAIPVRIARKRAPARQQKKNVLVTGIKVEPIGNGDYYGFEVSGPDRLFLLGDFTVTHNTVCFSYLTRRITDGGKRVVVMAHREEINDQISRTLSRFDVRHGMITAGALYDRRMMAHVASVQTLSRRLDRVQAPDYVIVDEAHHALAASSWGKVLAAFRDSNPNLRVIGVTATPERLSGEGLGETFDEMVLGPTTRELIDLGALSEYRLFAPSAAIDLSGVKMRGGDYAKDQLGAAMDKPAIIGSAVNEYRKLCDGMPAVAFCVSVEHAHHTAEQFKAAGYRAAAIDGKMDKVLRRQIVQDFGRGAINVLTSADIVSEGFDVPGIVAAILLRPTQSLALYLQQVGRALRPADGKPHAIILDHVRNSMSRDKGGNGHGLPDDPREWSLLGRERGKKKSADDASACRQCEKCYAVSPAAASKCRECGQVFPIKARKIEEVAGSLSEVEIARMRRVAAREQAAAKTLDELIAVGMARGMKNPHGWARHVHEARMAKQQRAG